MSTIVHADLGAGEDRATLARLLFDEDTDPAADLVHVDERTWTRAEVQARSIEVAAALAAAGVAPGQAVGVMLPNGADVIAALFGVWRAGAVYVPLNPRLTDSEIDHVLAAVSPAAVLTTPEHHDRPAFGIARAGGLGQLTIGEAGPVARFGALSITNTAGTGAGASAGAGARPGPATFEPDIALIQFTSGTTGRPKPVLLRHSGVLTLIDGVLAKLRAGAAAKPVATSSTPAASAAATPSATRAAATPMPNLVPVSLSLWAGIYNVLFAFRVGAAVVVLERFEPSTFAAVVSRFGIRSTVLPPAAMTMLADDETITDLAPLRYVRSITAPLSPLQARRFRDRFGIAVLNSYGQTEIGGEIVGWNAADSRSFGETKLGSVGRPHDGVRLRAVADITMSDAGAVGIDVEPGEPGELWVQTPALSAGYADGADLGDRLSADGWFRTGDYARVDADGFVWIEGRVSDMINRGGLKVYPAEVEEALRLDRAVADVAVVGVPDDRLGEVPVAAIVPRDPGAWDPDAVLAACRAHLAPYKVPARVFTVDALPRNEVGKVLSRDLIALAQHGPAGADHGDDTGE